MSDWLGRTTRGIDSRGIAVINGWSTPINGRNQEEDGEPISDKSSGGGGSGAGQGEAAAASLGGGGASAEGEQEEAQGGPNAIAGSIGLGPGDVLSRLFETGDNTLFFEEIGTTITTTAELIARLDQLGDVTVVQDDNDAFILDIQIEKELTGDAELAIDVLDGAVQLGGAITVSGDVKAKLRLGVDKNGFFIDADAFSGPEIVISNLQISGDIEASGKIGFLGVTVQGGSLQVDPQVAIEIDILDPGVDPFGIDDGVVRPYEFAADPSTMATETIRGNSAADDVVFTVALSPTDPGRPRATVRPGRCDAGDSLCRHQ